MIDRMVTAPAQEPLTLAEVKEHLQYTAADQDAYITRLISFARDYCEGHTKRAIASQTREATYDYFPDTIKLRPNVTSVTSVTYLDADGVSRVLSPLDYLLDNAAGSSAHWCLLMPGKAWPATQSGRANAVVVRYVAGYASQQDIPMALKQWMLLQIGNMFANRESVITGTIVGEIAINTLLDPYRVYDA